MIYLIKLEIIGLYVKGLMTYLINLEITGLHFFKTAQTEWHFLGPMPNHVPELSNFLQRHFEIPLFARSTSIDYLLNKRRHSPETDTYDQISDAIVLIYTKCLGFVQTGKGSWNLPHNGDNA